MKTAPIQYGIACLGLAWVAALALAQEDERSLVEMRQPILRHPNRVDLSFPVSGRLASIRFEEGDRIKAGDLLANLELDENLANLELHKARASASEPLDVANVRVDAARAALEAAANANRIYKKAIPAQEIHRLQLDLALAQAELQEKIYERRIAELELRVAQATHNSLYLRAPFDGTITRRFSAVGASVDLNKPLAQLVDTSTLRIEGYVFQDQVSSLKVNDRILIRSNSDREAVARLTFIDIGAQQISAMTRVWGELDPGHPLLEGEKASARIVRSDPRTPETESSSQ